MELRLQALASTLNKGDRSPGQEEGRGSREDGGQNDRGSDQLRRQNSTSMCPQCRFFLDFLAAVKLVMVKLVLVACLTCDWKVAGSSHTVCEL